MAGETVRPGREPGQCGISILNVMNNTTRQNVDPGEISKFAKLAEHWWDPDGEMKPLHQINPLRLRFIEKHARLTGVNTLDVGCGGGILSEAMALAGAKVTGIDLAEESLDVAERHAVESGASVQYACIPVEELAAEKAGQFDIVTCMEMLEHVPDPTSVIQACAQLAKPGGKVFFSTLNRNPKAFALAIVGAEYVLGMLPRGTHDYSKFIKPSELDRWSREAGLLLLDMTGIHYNPLLQHYRLDSNVDVNYIMACEKPV